MFARIFVAIEMVVAFVILAGISFTLNGCDTAGGDVPILPLEDYPSTTTTATTVTSTTTSTTSATTTTTTTTTTEWQASCEIEVAHAKASDLAYGGDDLSSMEREGWKRLSRYLVDYWWTNDEADLWERSGECILAFRGSDDPNDFWNDLVNVHPENYHGIEVMAGVKSEFEHLIEEIHSGGGRELVSSVCDKGFVVAGHSLGGALAQLFAVLVNKKENPLGWSRKVDAVYPIGSMPVGTSVLTNDQSPDGTFRGNNLFTSFWSPKESQVLVVDFAYFLPKDEDAETSNSKFKHIKLTRDFITPGGHVFVPASEQIPADVTLKCAAAYWGVSEAWRFADLHNRGRYIQATSGCGQGVEAAPVVGGMEALVQDATTTTTTTTTSSL